MYLKAVEGTVSRGTVPATKDCIESCRTHDWVMAHAWMSDGTHVNESWHTHEWMSHSTHMNQSQYPQQKTASSHVAHMNESWHTRLSHGTHVNESWRTRYRVFCSSSSKTTARSTPLFLLTGNTSMQAGKVFCALSHIIYTCAAVCSSALQCVAEYATVLADWKYKCAGWEGGLCGLVYLCWSNP